jgi:hypothetical protein
VLAQAFVVWRLTEMRKRVGTSDSRGLGSSLPALLPFSC